MSALITFHFKSKHLTTFKPVIYGSPPELGGGNPENGVEMVQIEEFSENESTSYNFIAEILFSNNTAHLKNNSSDNDTEAWYSYAFKPEFGQIFPEAASIRHFPANFYMNDSSQGQNQSSNNIKHIKLYDTEGLINAASDCPLVRFKINKHVDFGTEIFISGNCNELGNWKLSESRPLSYVNDGTSEYWVADVKFPILNFFENIAENQENKTEENKGNDKGQPKSQLSSTPNNSLLSRRRLIEYKYFLSSSSDDIQWEPEDNHRILLCFDHSSSSPSYIEVCDTFRYTDNVINIFSRSAFVNVINKRGPSRESIYSTQKSNKPKSTIKKNSCLELQLYQENIVKPGHVLLTFTVNCSFIQKRQRLIIVGSIPELGNWNPIQGLKMSDIHFPYWTASILVSRQNSKFSYKYVIEDTKYSNGDNANRFIWENSENRYCYGISNTSIDTDFPSTIAINDWYISPHVNKLFRGVTISVPLFSLKSSNSCGIGEYSDIKLAVDICRATGCSMIQLMPINDTMRVPMSAIAGIENEMSTSNSIHSSSSFGHYQGAHNASVTNVSSSNNFQFNRFQGISRGLSAERTPLRDGPSNRFPSSTSMTSFNDQQGNDSGINDTELEIWAGSNPYNIVSVFALNPVYINLQDVLNEELEIASKTSSLEKHHRASAESSYGNDNSFYKIYQETQDKAISLFSEIQNEIIHHRCMFERNGKVDYPSVLRFKIQLLKKIFHKIVQNRDDQYDLTRDKDFINFTNENEAWLKEYSVFCYLRDKYDTSDFTKWNNNIYHHSNRLNQFERTDEGFIGSKEDIDELYETYREEEDILFTLWLQYVCDRQMKSAKEYASTYSIALKIEMPYFVPFNSSDCWAFRRMFDFNSVSGSPPDMRCIEGQNFNVPVIKDWTTQAKLSNKEQLVSSSQILLTVSSDPSSTPSSQQSSSATKRSQYMKYGNKYPSMQKATQVTSDRDKTNTTSKSKSTIKDDAVDDDEDENLPLAAKWWRLRMKRMSSLFDAVEIDNVLSFFRNWVIPNGSYRSVNGYFSPSKPFTQVELAALYGILTKNTANSNQQNAPSTINMNGLTIERLVKPYIRFHLLKNKFDNEATRIANEFFTPLHIDERDDYYEFQERCNTEEKINNILKSTIFDEGRRDHYRTALFQLLSNVILVRETPTSDNENEEHDEIKIHNEDLERDNQYNDNNTNNTNDQSDRFHIRAELTIERVESLNSAPNRGNNFTYSNNGNSNDGSLKNNHSNSSSNGSSIHKKNRNVMGCTPRTTFSISGSRVFPSTSWLELDKEMRQKLLIASNDYFFGSRNTEAWIHEARSKFKVLNESSSMLLFSNDFNEISAAFERELENQQIIKYNVPRYPRNRPNIFQIERENRIKQKANPFTTRHNNNEHISMSHWSAYYDSIHKSPNSNKTANQKNQSLLKSEDIDYLSQCVPTPVTEDCLRSWWENNRASTFDFWQNEIVSKSKKNSPENQARDENDKHNPSHADNNQNNNNNNNDSGHPSTPVGKHGIYNYLDDDAYFCTDPIDEERQPYISEDLASHPPPKTCEPWILELIVSKYLACRSMWCTFMLQDLVSMVGKFRRQYPNDECVHRPEQGERWQYRFPYKLEDILNDSEFTGKLRYLVDKYGRL
ncbi:4-alpha-glucanotransferase dpe2 [Tritrichomonas musculus]|uniref:4-alpha-glucanotransferase n=1 Tax=Tritrichomonas musculus TaxID=1915356 RepID=A0ABR2JW51_9EUKA